MQRLKKGRSLYALAVTGLIETLADASDPPGILDLVLYVLPGLSVHHHERRFTVDRQNRRAAGVLKVRHEARGVAFELGQGADIFGDVHGVLIVNASNKMRT